MSPTLGLVANVLYATFYVALHSVLASHRAKRSARHTVGPSADRWYRLVYNLVAGITLAPQGALLVALPDRFLYSIPSPWVWLTGSIQVAALVGMVLIVLKTGLWRFVGLTADARSQPEDSSRRLVQSGPYARVRHPLYLLGLLLIWLTPWMTVNRLAVAIAYSVYLYVGSILEERRLIAEFGEEYREYRGRVPRLLPRIGG